MTHRMKIVSRHLIVVAVLSMSAKTAIPAEADEPTATARPNVIFVLTDDLGYGDLSCHGNPVLKTPNIDQLSRDGVRFSQFFVSPLCEPSRCSLMTGRNKVIGRRIEPNEQTLPQMFQRGGYATGLFGKWHLGDGHPFLPVDKGFDEQFMIANGAVDHVENYWGNSDFDTWFKDSKEVWHQTKGYYTDALFDHAMQWMDSCKDKPFFCYLATLAPHEPWDAPEEYKQPFRERGMTEEHASYYGACANIDHNIARLRQWMADKGLEKNTLLIFMSDNGSALAGRKLKSRDGKNTDELFNAGLRGGKGSVYEGGSRQSAFFVWPGTLAADREVDQLAMHYDLLPTLSDLLGIPLLKDPGLAPIEGISLKGLLLGEKPSYPKRYDVIYQGYWPPDQPLSQYKNTSIRSQDYRLVNGNELYDHRTDEGETNNVIEQHPEVAAELKSAYDQWWEANSAELPELRVDKAYPLGEKIGEKFTMNALFYYDSLVYPAAAKWFQTKFWLQRGLVEVLTDEAAPAPKKPPLMGCWKIDFQAAGTYEFVLRKGSPFTPKELTTIRKGHAHVALGDERSEVAVEGPAEEVKLTVQVAKPGVQMVECWFDGQRTDGKPSGAYFVDITRTQ